MYVAFFFLEIKRLRKNIKEVACSLPVCYKRSDKIKMLGGRVPDFFLYLKKFIENNQDRKFLLWSDVKNIINNEYNMKGMTDCKYRTAHNDIEERDIVDATRFLRDTGMLIIGTPRGNIPRIGAV